MKCPNCSKDVLTFWQWGQGINAFRYYCPHCLEPLKANKATIMWFVGVMLWVLVVVALCIIVQKHWEIEETRFRSFLFPILLLTVLPWIYLAWKKDGCVSRRDTNEREDNR